MQLNAKDVRLSHNQVVPGSSPGGTTSKKTLLENFQEGFFDKKKRF